MTSSSSLYGTVTTQNSSSTNSTSLYGEAGTPIPDSNGNVVVRGDLIVLSGNILTTATTGNIFPANATTINIGLAATAFNIGANTGTTTINNALVADSVTAGGADFGNITIAVADDQTITTTANELRVSSATGFVKLEGVTSLYTDTTGTFNLLNLPATVNAFQNATALSLGDPTGTTTIRNDLTVQGGVTANGADFGDIQIAVGDDQLITTTTGELRLSGATGIIKLEGVTALYTDTAGTFNLLNQPLTVNAFRNATALEMGEITGTTTIRNNLTVGGTDINIAQATDILYSENNDRLNRPTIQSTTGNTSGLRVAAPNTGTSAQSNVSVNNSSDPLNTEFLQIAARGSALTGPFRILTGKFTAGVQSAASKSVSFVDYLNTYATVNPAGPTIGTDLTTKTYVDSIPNITYTIDATSATGGANFNLTGSDASVDTIKFASGTGITVSRTDANTITVTNTGAGTTYTIDATSITGGANLNLVGSDLSTDSVAYKGSGATTVTRTDANTVTISSTDTNTTYTQNISSTTGGANLNLVGSDSTTDTVKFADGTGVTVAYTDASTATVSIGQAVAITDNVTFNSVTTPTLNSGASALTITGGAVNPSIITVDGTQTTVALNGGLGGDDALLTLSSGYLEWAHTAGMMGSVSGTWGLNSNGTTSFPSFVFPYADGSSNQVLRTNGSGILAWYTPTDANTTYDFNATSSTGGANLNLVGSDSTTDTVKLTDGGGITATYTSGTVVTLGSTATSTNTANAIVARDASGNFSASGATLGNITVGVATDQTIATTSGDLILDSASGTLQLADANLSSTAALSWTVIDNTASALSIGATGKADILKVVSTNAAEGVTMSGTLGVTGVATIGDDSKVLGQMYATRNTTWTPPPVPLTTLAGQNGIYAVSSANGAGYAPAIQAIYYSGDTTAGVQASAAFAVRGASGTNSAPGAAATNQVMGTMNYDGYGTTNWANTIASQNQGAGTASLTPLQAQGYARQAFADSGAVATTVTGASGTGSVATLTFTLQNTAPYAVGQTVAIAGMTPSGYNNAAAVITAATTSSISYANATTGFTSGGTITATRTVTAAGMGFRVRGYASSTNMTSANRFNFMDLTASAATFKSAAYTFANDVITGSTLTATNYLTMSSSGITMGNVDGITNIVRASGAIAGQRPVQTVRNTQTVTAAPTTGDGPTYRLQTAGSNGTVYNLAEIGSSYSSTGDTNFSFGLANGDQNTGTMTVVFPVTSSLSGTTIKATATPTATPGGNTLATVAEFTPANSTFKSDIHTLQTAAGAALPSGKITYSRQYGNFLSSATQTNPVANAQNLMVFGTTDIANGVSIVTNGTALTRITFSTACVYDMQFSAQIAKTGAGNDNCYIWLKKNGTTVAETAGITRVSGNGDRIMASWNYLVNAAAGDYYEIAWSATDTDVILQASSPGGVVPSVPSVILSVVPVGA